MSHSPSRTRFYLDKRNKKFLGVCSGIANYTGIDVTMVRIVVASAMILTGFIIPIYFVSGLIAEDQPREMSSDDGDERQFWQGVRASPSQSAREIRGRMRDIDRRLADIEQFVTTDNRSLAREIEELR